MRSLAFCCFLLSGASGLIFQVIWSRMFSLVFGATSLALSAVLTAFMAGLALGSHIAGRLADRVKSPLRAYALAELGIGITALLIPLLIPHFSLVNRALYDTFANNYVVLSAGRFLVTFVVILVPTALMGATLPLLSRFFVTTAAEHRRVGVRVGALYAVNTLGAVIGTAGGGFVLLPALGLWKTNLLAVSINLLLGLTIIIAAYQLARRRPQRTLDPDVAPLLEELEGVPAVEVHVSARARTAAVVAFALSGAIAMIYQVLWTRALNMTIGSSVYSFTIVLTAFLIGLSGGAAVIGRFSARSRDPVLLLALNHLAIATLAGLSTLLIDKLGSVFIALVGRAELNASRILWSQFGLTILTLLPATFAMGGIFPLTIRIWSADVERVGRDVGTAYSINTLGAIAGSFLAGFVVLPLLQLQRGLTLAATISLLLALAVAGFATLSRATRLVFIGACGLLLVVGMTLPRWDLLAVTAGLFRPTIARDMVDSRGGWPEPEIVYYRDGLSTTVSVEKWSKKHYSLKNNGKVDASTGDDMPTQIAVGLLPVVLHPRTPDYRPEVALVGYASGVSAGAVLQYPVKSLDVIELEPAIIEAAEFFASVNKQPLKDKRTHLHADDGRNFLSATRKRYDVIINEPSNPWITGVSNLFTREYFETIRGRLRKDGIFCSWAQLYEMGPRRIKSIYRAFSEVFPFAYALAAARLSSDTFLVGSMRPLDLDIKRLRRVFAIKTVRAEMQRAEIATPDDIYALFLLSPSELKAFTVGAQINTDDNALVEFAAPRDLYNHRRYDYFQSRLYAASWPYGRLKDLIKGYDSGEDYAGLVYALFSHGKAREAYRLYPRVEQHTGRLAQRVQRLVKLLETFDVATEEVPLIDGDPQLTQLKGPRLTATADPKLRRRVSLEYPQVMRAVRLGRFARALQILEAWPDKFLEKAGDDFQLLWGVIAYKTRNFHQSVNILSPLWSDRAFLERRPAVLYYLGRSFYGNADYKKSVQALEQWIDIRVRGGHPWLPKPLAERDTPAE
ncbi:MAG: fused MFS/spermidine synthase [Deltaproteobacteria bacterium]|nr:fused MFS/spermidine synthase [Deltaproteobacteria bacterium]